MKYAKGDMVRLAANWLSFRDEDFNDDPRLTEGDVGEITIASDAGGVTPLVYYVRFDKLEESGYWFREAALELVEEDDN